MRNHQPDIIMDNASVQSSRPWSQPDTSGARKVEEREAASDSNAGISASMRKQLRLLVEDAMTVIPWDDKDWTIAKQLAVGIIADGSRNASARVPISDEFYDWRSQSASTSSIPPGAFITIDYNWIMDIMRMNEAWINMRLFHDDISENVANCAVRTSYQKFVKELHDGPYMNLGDWCKYSVLYSYVDSSRIFQKFRRQIKAFYCGRAVEHTDGNDNDLKEFESYVGTRVQLAFLLCHEVGHFINDDFRSGKLTQTKRNWSEEFEEIVADRTEEIQADQTAIRLLTCKQPTSLQQIFFFEALYRFYAFHLALEFSMSCEEFDDTYHDHPRWSARVDILLNVCDDLVKGEVIEPSQQPLVRYALGLEMTLSWRTQALLRGYSRWIDLDKPMKGCDYWSVTPGVEKDPSLSGVSIPRPKPVDHSGAREWHSRGMEWGKAGDHQKAKECFLKAIQLNNDYQDAWTNYGLSCLNTGAYAESEKALRHAIDLDPKDNDAFMGLTRLFAVNGRTKDFIDLMKKLQ